MDALYAEGISPRAACHVLYYVYQFLPQTLEVLLCAHNVRSTAPCGSLHGTACDIPFIFECHRLIVTPRSGGQETHGVPVTPCYDQDRGTFNRAFHHLTAHLRSTQLLHIELLNYVL